MSKVEHDFKLPDVARMGDEELLATMIAALKSIAVSSHRIAMHPETQKGREEPASKVETRSPRRLSS
jgi:hypothetical protein